MTIKKTNLPAGAQIEAEPGEISQTIQQALDIASWPPVDKGDYAAIRKRCRDYFQYCIDTDRRPFIESLCLALGITRQTLWNWEQHHDERGEIATWCKQIIRSLLEQWSLTGRLNPPVAIFLMKNISGYADSIQIEATTANQTPEPNLTPEQIAKVIDEDLPSEDDLEPAVLTDSIL